MLAIGTFVSYHLLGLYAATLAGHHSIIWNEWPQARCTFTAQAEIIRGHLDAPVKVVEEDGTTWETVAHRWAFANFPAWLFDRYPWLGSYDEDQVRMIRGLGLEEAAAWWRDELGLQATKVCADHIDEENPCFEEVTVLKWASVSRYALGSLDLLINRELSKALEAKCTRFRWPKA